MQPTNEVLDELGISDEVRKVAHEATGALYDKLDSLSSKLDKALRPGDDAINGLLGFADPPDQQTAMDDGRPKGWFNDPFALLDSLGMGYRANPTNVTYETLRSMTEKNTLLASILGTRLKQVGAFCRPQENRYSVGYIIRPRGPDKTRRLTPSEKSRVARISNFISYMGNEHNITRPNFTDFMQMAVRDRLTYDQMNFEKVWTRGGKLHEALVHDASSIRIAMLKDPKGGPIPLRDQRNRTAYVQLLNGEIVTEFTPRTMAFCIANPRSSLKVGGYGFPEPQQLLMTVTAHIWAEDWNRKAFSQGSTIKGVLNMKGNITRQKYDDFKRMWTAQVGGIVNAWKTPIINSDGIEFVPMQMSNTEMGYQMWIEYLVKIACAIYQMDPSEINFDLRGSSQSQQPMFMTTNEAQQKLSKDRGLKPLLRFLEDSINRHVVWAIDDEFELAFVGLDAKTEEQAIELRQKQTTTHVTINEARAMDDLDPVEDGEIIANPAFIQWKQQAAMAKQQAGGAGGQPPGAPPGGGEGDDQQAPQQPYQGKLGRPGQQPSEGGQQAAQKMQAMAAGGEQKDKHEEADYMRILRRDDWESTVHASVQDNDLKKSYYDVENY